MRVYQHTDSPWRCGHWNGSPIEILVMPDIMTRIPPGEAYHYHPFHEYYIVLQGRATLFVEETSVPLEAGMIVMVQPGERHRVTWVDPQIGVRWVLVKERGDPNGNIVLPEPELGGDDV